MFFFVRFVSFLRGLFRIDPLAVEQRLRDRAYKSLPGDDEAIAWEVSQLLLAEDGTDGEEFERYQQQLHVIGKKLCSHGGSTRMLKVAFRAENLAGVGRGPWVRMLEYAWDGLCGWMR